MRAEFSSEALAGSTLAAVNEGELREEMCAVCKDLWVRGLVGGAEGNVSCRLDRNRILTTPAGAIKGKLNPDDLALISIEGKCLDEHCPSSEIAMHVRIYALSDAMAVVHAHPSAATAFALAGRNIPSHTIPEADIVLGDVALVPFAIPGTEAMGDALAPYLETSTVFLLGSHGAATIGESLAAAYIKMETLERVSKTLLLTGLLGGPQPLLEEGIRWLSDF